jgi:aspartyl-tRNA(Asn)/glutamyl-tRNA(Gln) amidotransferase subunit A
MIRSSASEMAAKLIAGETTSVELTKAHLERIAEVDSDVHAFLYVDTEGALAQAEAIDAKRAEG